MSDEIRSFEYTKEAFSEVANKVSEIDQIFKKANEQADTRRGAIQTIHKMCDALQLACVIISEKLTKSVIEFNNLKYDKEEILRGFFERTAIKFSDKSLRLLLHDGEVCGELHALGDSFSQPFSKSTTGGVSFLENVKTFFKRSNKMSITLSDLYRGEINYLHDFSRFLNDVRDHAEKATGIRGDVEKLREDGDELVKLMRDKRRKLQIQVENLQVEADNCIEKLH